MRKTIYTLNIGNYAPELCGLTYPLMKKWADKIGACINVISSRAFPEWPITYEKLQISKLARLRGDEWAIFLDSDTLVSPEMFDPTDHLKKDTICHNGRDFAGIRWKYDQYFRRDGRNWGSCNWCSIASDWCLDLWRPLDDLTLEGALANINITINERNSGHCKTEHLIDDYALSRNIARFGLKATTLGEMCGALGWRNPQGQGINSWMWHKYTISNEQKLREMLAILTTPNGHPAFAATGEMIHDGFGNPVVRTAGNTIVPACGLGWGLMKPEEADAYWEKWGTK